MPISPSQNRTSARRAALRSIVASEVSETPLFALLDRAAMESSSRSFARELCGGVMRNRARLDYSLQPLLSKKPLGKLDAPVREALRLALYERLVLQTPIHVVADEYAGLMRGEKLKSAVGFVNAIARRLPEKWRDSPDRTKNPAQFLAVEYSHPLWIVERYLARFGFDRCENLLRADNEIAPLCLRVNTMKTTRDRVLESLRSRGLDARIGDISPDAIWVFDAHGAPDSWPEWTRGEIIAQDEAAQIPARVLSPKKGWIILDAASAPGGKTTHLAQLANDECHIIACDRSESRLRLVRQNAARLNLQSIESRTADFRELKAENFSARSASSTRSTQIDAILLDAPCLGTGTWRRRPDARWRKTAAQLAELAQLQSEMLDAAAQLLDSSGVLVYSTCSLEPEENELQIEGFLTRHPNWQLDVTIPDAAQNVARDVQDGNGFWRTSPGRTSPGRTSLVTSENIEYSLSEKSGVPDGMFAARLVCKS